MRRATEIIREDGFYDIREIGGDKDYIYYAASTKKGEFFEFLERRVKIPDEVNMYFRETIHDKLWRVYY